MRPSLSGCRAALVVALAVALAPPPAGALELVEIAPGVFAAIQPRELRFDDANTLLVPCGTTGALLVDPPSNPDRLRALIDEIRRRGWTVGEVVSTHWHGDHTQGIAAIVEAFGETVEIIGHETLAEDVPGRAAVAHRERVELFQREIPAARERLERRVRRDGSPLADEDVGDAREAIDRAAVWLEQNADARFLPPTTTYENRLTLERCGRRIELHHFRAHTRGDTVVRLPAEGLIATGDLLDDLPYVGHGHPRSWVLGLDEIDRWNARLVLPGHGPLFSGREQGREKLDAVRGYLRDLVSLTDEARAANTPLEEVQSRADLSRWRALLSAGDETAERFFDQTVGEAIGRAFEEAQSPASPAESVRPPR